MVAMIHGNYELAKELLAKTSNFNSQYGILRETELIFAVKLGNVELVQLLLQK